MAAGTILREWPPSSTEKGIRGPNAFILHASWYSKSNAPGPYVFVFEFAAPAEIYSLGFHAWEVDADAPTTAQAVRVEASTQGPDSSYSTLGDYVLQATDGEQDFPLSRPAMARWLRVTLQQRPGVEYTSLGHVFAYGKLQPPATANPISGRWLLDNRPGDPDDKLFHGPRRLAAAPDPALVYDTLGILQIVQKGSEFHGGFCSPISGADSVYRPWGGSQSGARVTWSDQNAGQLPDGVLNAEGNMIVGASPDGDNPYLLIRPAPGPDCTHGWKPVGSGQTVLVLTADGDFAGYPPAINPNAFPGYRFVPLSIAVFSSEALVGVDTVVLGYICNLGKMIAPWQAQGLVDFIQAGHKLIIDDADKCTSTDYSFLPYGFLTSNPGAKGKSGDNLILVEPNTLGNDTKASEQYVDVPAYASDPSNEIGDANTVTTQDPHWCGHLFGTNTLKVNGFMHMYAPFGQGLIIFNGFDQDDTREAAYRKLLSLELQQPVPALLPCTEPVIAKFLIAPSKQVPITSGQARQIQVPLQVLANQGYTGTVALAAIAPADALWKTALSVAQITLKGDTAPVNLTIDVPADAGTGGHVFEVTGKDAHGNTASATITLVAAAPPKVEEVQTVVNGCTQQMTVGSDALFAFASATLTPSAQQTLAALGPAIKKIGHHPLQINGYTDSIGTDSYNLLLSDQRAKAVRDWLAASNYVAATTPIKGFGKKDPVSPNANPDGSDNPSGRAKNRRVEVLIDTCQ